MRFALIAGLVLATAACGKNEETGVQLPPSPMVRGESPNLQATIDALQVELTAQPQTATVTRAVEEPVRLRDLTEDQITPTAPGTILQNGETWYAEGWSLTVENFTYKTLDSIRFTLRNHTDRIVVFPGVDGHRIVVSSEESGQEFRPCEYGCCGTGYNALDEFEIPARSKKEWVWSIGRRVAPGNWCFGADFSPTAETLILRVENIADIFRNARWQTEVPRP